MEIFKTEERVIIMKDIDLVLLAVRAYNDCAEFTVVYHSHENPAEVKLVFFDTNEIEMESLKFSKPFYKNFIKPALTAEDPKLSKYNSKIKLSQEDK